MYNIFIIGKSNTGKTTTCNKIVDELKSRNINSSVYEAGGWVRNAVDQHQNDFDLRKQMTDYTKTMLSNNVLYSVQQYNKYKSSIPLDVQCNIIVGVRNPIDFCNMIHECNNMVVLMKDVHSNSDYGTYKFDNGVRLIENIITYFGNDCIKLSKLDFELINQYNAISTLCDIVTTELTNQYNAILNSCDIIIKDM